MENPLFKLIYSDTLGVTPSKTPKRAPGTGNAHMRIERKGRGGKTVTILDGLSISDDQLLILLKELQRHCGTGGTIKEHHIELQGDVREKVRPLLEKRGYHFK